MISLILITSLRSPPTDSGGNLSEDKQSFIRASYLAPESVAGSPYFPDCVAGPRRDIYEELRKNLLRDRSQGGR